MSTPYDELDRADRRLYTMVKNQGDYRRVIGNATLTGINGGIRRVRKGFGTWEKDSLSQFASNRERDSNGRFIPHTPQKEDHHDRQ